MESFRVYVRYNQDNTLDGNGQVVSYDYSTADSTDTTLTISLASTPPLRAGVYWISLVTDIQYLIGSAFSYAAPVGSITANVAPCTFGVSPATVSGSGASFSGSFSVSTTSGCPWTASSDSTWLTVTPTAGSGSLSEHYTAAANTSSIARSGQIKILGQYSQAFVTVNQGAACTYSLTPTTVAVAAAGGSGNLTVTTASGCPWTAASDSGWLAVSSGTGTGTGSGTVGYTAAGNSTSAARTGKISVAGQTATFSQVAPGPTISLGGVVNGASFQPGIQAGSWVTIAGSLLAQTNPGRVWRPDEFIDNNLPTSLDGVSVTINGKPAYVYYISPTQLNVLAPNDTALGTVDVTVKTPIGTASGTALLQTYSPAFFVFGPGGNKYLAAVHTDGTLVGPPNLFGAGVATQTAAPGDRILLFGTGFGPTSPEVAEQSIYQGAAWIVDPNALSIQIGGVPAKVEFAGITSNGLYQFNVVIPQIFGGDQPVIASIGGFNSQSNLFLTIAGDPQPALTVTPTSLPFLFQSGGSQPASQTLTLSSSVRSIPFTATATTAMGGNWLSVTSSSATTPATLTVTVNTGGLASGTYNGSVRITAADASNSPLVIPVTLAPVPQLAQQYTISTLAGNGGSGSTGDGGPASQASVSPAAVTVDAAGSVYVVDSQNGRVRRVAAGTHTITTVAGGGSGGDGGPAVNALLNSPRGAAVDAAGNLYIAEASANRVRKVTIATGTISTVAGNGTAGFSGDGGLATTAQLSEPRAVAVDRAGNLYIADNINSRIRKVSADTGAITTLAGTGQCAAYPGDGHPASTVSICEPYNAALDDAGNLYVDSRTAGTIGRRVLKIAAATGAVTSVAGTGDYSNVCVAGGSPATQASLSMYLDLTVDGSGNVYVSETWNHCVHRVDAGSGMLRVIAGNGEGGFLGDGGPATSAQVYFPGGLSVSQAGVVYFADTANNRVRVLTPVP